MAWERLTLALAAALLVGAAAPASPLTADQGGPIMPNDIMRLRDMREVRMSPDGRTVLFTVQAQMATFGSPAKTIWIVPTDGSAPARRFIVSAGVDDTPRWSPDGRWIAFLSNRKNPLTGGADSGFEFKPESAAGPGVPGQPAEIIAPPIAGQPGEPSRQLWLIARDGGEAVPLTALPNDIADFEWSPDGKRIAFLSADPDTPAEKAEQAAKRDAVEVDHPRHVTRLWLLDLAEHRARRISPPDVDVSAASWSPDGRQLALKVASAPTLNDLFYHSRIVLFDPASETIGRTLIDHAEEAPRWSPDGRSIVTAVIRTPGFIGLGARVIDVATGAVAALADDYPGLITNPNWTPDSCGLVAQSFAETRSSIVRIDRAGHVTTLAKLDGEASDLSLSHDGRRMAVALSSPDRPADVWTGVGGALRPVTRINAGVAAWHLGAVSQVSWTNSKDGKTIYGVLVTPPGYLAGTPIKTVVQIHGGPEWAWWSGWLGSWHEWAQMLATHGYAVLLPNPRGSDGQGTAFARAVGSDWGGMDFQDVLDGVDALVARKIADPARLGIGGWSYGGFMSAWAVTHSDRFKAAIVGAGPVDMTAMARITDTPDFTTGYFGEPSTALAALDASSSVRSLDRVHVPVLVLHGEGDQRVPVTLGLEFYRGLRLLGKPAEMVHYPREPHWFHEPAHQEDVQRRVLAWFDRYL